MLRILVPVLIAMVFGAGAGRAATAAEENTIVAYERISRSVVYVLCRGIEVQDEGDLVETVSSGSGFAFGDGYVLTNYHVIENAMEISLYNQDDRLSPASIVGTAPDYDLALLKASFSPEDLPPAPLNASRELRIGQKILAVGSPFGLENSVTAGIVSGLHRELYQLAIGPKLIQFDASINPGQSGGPLVNSSGEVVGVILAKVRGSEAVGFAIPVEIVMDLVPDLIRMGHRFEPQVGFQGVDVGPELATLFDLEVVAGFLVERVEAGSPAELAGLEAGERVIALGDRQFVLGGDIIVAVNGQAISGGNDLTRYMRASRPGAEIVISIFREGQVRDVTLTIQPMSH